MIINLKYFHNQLISFKDDITVLHIHCTYMYMNELHYRVLLEN